MSALVFKRLFSTFSPSASADGAAPRSESLPPLVRRRTSGWVRRLGERSRSKALAAARIEVFSLVSHRHDQAHAAGRLAELDLHFPRRDRS